MLDKTCAKKWKQLKPIPEQIALITDDYRFKVVPAGRRCLAKGTLVKTPNGSKEVQDLDIGDLVIGWDDIESPVRVKKVFINGEQSVTPLINNYKILFFATPSHQILSEQGLIKVERTHSFNPIITNTGVIKLHKGKSKISETFDIEVDNDTNLYVLECGVITHNSGKTERAKRFMLKACWSNPGNNYFLAAPTREQVKKIFWKDILKLSPTFLVKRINRSDLEIEYINGTTLTLVGLDKPERIEGSTWHGGVVDEADNLKPHAWEENIMPALGTVDVNNPDYRAWCWMIGAPEGRGLLYKSHLLGLSEEPEHKNWKTYMWYSSVVLSEQDLIEYKSTMDAKRFRREFECSFEDLGNVVVHAFSEQENVSMCKDNGRELTIGMDFNLNPMSAVVGSIIDDKLYIWKEYEIERSNTTHMMQTIRADFPNRELNIYPDPTGGSGSTKALFGQTDHSIIKSFGGNVIAPPSNKSDKDAINILNAMMCDANGRRRIFIDPSLTKLINCLLGWQYDTGVSGNQTDKKHGLDHLPDALKYITLSAFNVLSSHNATIIEEPNIY